MAQVLHRGSPGSQAASFPFKYLWHYAIVLSRVQKLLKMETKGVGSVQFSVIDVLALFFLLLASAVFLLLVYFLLKCWNIILK